MLRVNLINVITFTTLRGTHNTVGYNLSVWPAYGITHPVQERLATRPRSMYPTFFEQWCRFFYIPHELDVKWKCCETGPMVCCPYLRRLESLQMSLQRQHFLTLSVCSARVSTRDFKLSRPVLFRLSETGGGHLLWLLKKLRGILNELLHNLDQEK